MSESVLKKIVNHLNIRFPIAELSRELDYSKGVVSQYFNGKKEMSENFKELLENKYNINVQEFEENEPKMMREQKEVYQKVKNDNHKIIPEPKYKGVPYYDVDFTASFLEIANNQTSKPDSYIQHPFFNGCDYVVRASGQSMAKLIKHGDAIGLIKLNNWAEFLPYGEVYAIVTSDGHRLIKIVTKGESDDSYTLISKPTDNKKDEFPNQQIKITSIISIFRVQASSHLF